MKKLHFFHILFAISVLLTGCLKLAFPYLDRILLYKINDYFDLNDSQEEWIKPRLRKHIQWLKSTGFEILISYLREAETRASKGLSHEDIQWAWDSYLIGRSIFLRRLIPDGSDLLASLTPTQVNHFSEALQESNEELNELASMEREDREEEIYDKWRDRLEEWLDDLNDSQEALLKSELKKMPSNLELYLKYRKGRQKKMILLLKNDAAKAKIRKTLEKWWLHREETLPDYFKEADKKRREAIFNLILKLDQTLTPEQRKYVQEQIREKINDLQDLKE
jgi:Spy/CpxP family protein refolding chaperone